MIEQDEFAVARGGLPVRVGGITLLAAALFVGLCPVQLWGTVYRSDALLWVSRAMFIWPPLLFASSILVFRARPTGALLGAATAATSSLGMGYFVVQLFASRAFLSMPVLAVVASVLAMAFAFIAWPACRRAAAERERLQKEGLDLSF